MSDNDETSAYYVMENPLYPGGIPTWRFSPWSLAAVLATGIGGLFSVVGQAANLLSREFEAQANYSRQEHEMRTAEREWRAEQAAAAEELRRMVEGDPS